MSALLSDAQLDAIVAFARKTFRNDGAEGETVHALADAVAALKVELATANAALADKAHVLEAYAALLEQNVGLGKDRDRVAAELATAKAERDEALDTEADWLRTVAKAERRGWDACREAAREAFIPLVGTVQVDEILAALEPPATGAAPATSTTNLTLDHDGLFIVEAWEGTRKLTLYVGSYDWVKVWGPDCDAEMSDGTTKDAAPKQLFDWLIGKPDGAAPPEAPGGCTEQQIRDALAEGKREAGR